ncbi:MAG: hypothetical protein M1840_007002 [Geoglossum simile]|nr:MAG: hypothetical protein M1840_007002 [Geoglossum simile]
MSRRDAAGAKSAARQIHWQAPVAMLGSFLVGVCLAVGHHFFYRSRDGRVVRDQGQQAWDGRIGLGLAFLVKVFLAAAVSIACVQNLWWVLRSRPVPLAAVDSMFDLLRNAWWFTDVRVWVRGPVVVVLAAITWLIPLSAVITPSTLTVRPSPSPGERPDTMPIPGINFTKSGNFCDVEGIGRFFSASPGIKRLGLSVAVQGTVLNIPPIAPNMSYTLRFFGPAVKCPNANETVTQQINSAATGLSISPSVRPYIAFTPSRNFTADIRSALGTNAYLTTPPAFDFFSTDYARLYVVTPSSIEKQYKASECGLYNASYEVDFRFDNGIQQLNVRNFRYLNGIPYLTDVDYLTSKNKTLVELETQHISYQAIMDSLGNILVGNCMQPASAPPTGRYTQILSTALVNTKEIRRMEQMVGAHFDFWQRNFSLAEGIEELSRNITLSLFSSSVYLQSTRLIPDTNVTFRYPQNVYLYSQKYLLLAYGIAILFTLFGVIVGFLSLFANGASFSNSFSTVLRVTRDPKLLEIMHPAETSGTDPLPKHLADTMVYVKPVVVPDPVERYAGLSLKRASAAGQLENTEERLENAEERFENTEERLENTEER